MTYNVDIRANESERRHDPLCRNQRLSFRECNCDLIAEARDDERKMAAKRVEATCAHTKYEGCPPCSHSESAAAVRGES